MAEVIKPWTASYDPALAVSEGETVTPGQKDSEFPGWQWVVNAGGLGGWIPAEILQGNEIMQDFDTAEISLNIGEMVEPLETRLAWTRVRHADGRTGWIPSSHLAR